MDKAVVAALMLARRLEIEREAREVLEGVIREPMDYHNPQDGYLLPEGYVMQTHRRARCAGDFCSVHNPSDHPLKDAPRNWRGDRGLMERVCPHGIGHPDPDDLAYKRRTMTADAYERRAYGVHGCDGCCRRKVFDDFIEGEIVSERLEIEG